MKAKRAIAVTATLALVVGSAAAWAQEPKQVMPSKVIHEQTAKHSEEVVDQLMKIATPQTVFDYINFYLSGPVVVLTGFTSKGVLKDAAEQQVQKLKWVDHVVNEIKIVQANPETRRLGLKVLDILERACPQSFSQDRASIRILVTEKFDVTLEGFVNPMDKDTFAAALVGIKNLPLVGTVTNHTLVAKT